MAEPLDKLTIETPELIPLEFPLAGVGSRFLAFALDYLIQFVIGLALFVVGEAAWPVVGQLGRELQNWIWAIVILVGFTFQFGYFAGFEAWWNGQTPGKRRLRLRVIKDSGRAITPFDAVVRNLLRIVDSLPGMYAVGIISMLFSSKNKRLGDFVAGTVVVHEKPLSSEAKMESVYAAQPTAAPADLALPTPSEEQFRLLEAFLLRRDQLAPDLRARIARDIAHRVTAGLNIPEDQGNPEALVEKLARAYRERASLSQS